MLYQNSVNTYWVKIFISGPIEIAKQIIRRSCLNKGLCVNIQPTDFVYTGGEEAGYVVELINYPRFPSTKEGLLSRASELALELLNETFQHSVLVMTPETTIWTTKRKESKPVVETKKEIDSVLINS